MSFYSWRTFAYELFAYEQLHTKFFHTNFFFTNLCPDELLSLRIFYIRPLYHTNICIRALAFELLRTYFIQTSFIPYEHLLTNNCVRTLRIRNISIRAMVPGSYTEKKKVMWVVQEYVACIYFSREGNYASRPYKFVSKSSYGHCSQDKVRL